jgi:hypothetical protein
MKRGNLLWFAAAFALVSPSWCPAAPASQATESAPPAELLQTTNLSEVVRHLYRWYLDENDVERIANQTNMEFRVRRVNAKLDPGDQSIFAEIVLPQLDTIITLKKADYTVEETKAQVKSRNFRIKNVGLPDGALTLAGNQGLPLPHAQPAGLPGRGLVRTHEAGVSQGTGARE